MKNILYKIARLMNTNPFIKWVIFFSIIPYVAFWPDFWYNKPILHGICLIYQVICCIIFIIYLTEDDYNPLERMDIN